MRTRHVLVVAFLGVAPFALQSCSSDSTTFAPVEAGGEGGEATSKGGSAGSGESSGQGGSGESSGQGGGGNAGASGGGNASGGDAGAAQGGSGASSGEGGQSGGGAGGDASGGDAASGAGNGGGGESADAGRAGEGGTPGAGGAVAGGEGGGAGSGQGGADAGAGGGGTPEELAHCAYECSADEDCESPGIIEYVCDTLTKRCSAPDLACDEHRDCVAFASSWTLACENDDACLSAADVCVDARGGGRCARSFSEDTPCPLPDQVAIARARFGDPESVVQVCGRTNGRCGDGTCFLGCTGDSDCGQGAGDTCDTESGRCACLDDNECTSGAISHCNPDTRRCDECASDFDCFLDVSRDHCVGGRCGCSSAEVCLASVFPDATPVCE